MRKIFKDLRTRIVGMVAPRKIALLIDTATGYSSEVIQGIAQYAREHEPWELLIQPRGARERKRMPRHWRPEGVIARVTHRALARDLKRLDVPIVNVSRSSPPGFRFPQVAIDEKLTGVWAANHLLERGFRNFGYCGLTTQPHYIDGCGPAYTGELSRRGMSCRLFRPFSRGGPGRPDPTHARLERWLRSLPTPIGVFAAVMEDAYALCDACSAAGLYVPESVAILAGEDDALLGSIANPPISCIDPDSRRVGYEAATQLARLLAGSKPPKAPRRVSPLGVVSRRSTDTVAVDDPDLAAAIRLLRERATTAIHVSDVLRSVPLSRRKLEQRFKQVVGRSPAAEIRRLRIERAKGLLAETDWKMPRIAAAAGFSYTEVMNQVFSRELRLTPTEYRRQSRPGGRRVAGDSHG
jgi:LacI family transcriptional regulator